MKYIVLIVLFSLLPLFDLLHPGIPKGHDTTDHVARIANFYQSLSEGNLVPRWAANLNWGYGHPILMFLYPLPSYAASLLHAFGIPLAESVKLVFGISFILSMVFFYLWARKPWGDLAGFCGALLYGFAPYRFVDLYVRGAIGEHTAFTFIPLILLALWYQAKKQTLWSFPLLIIGSFGLVLSHNAISIIVIPVVIVYAIYLWYFETHKSSSFIAKCILAGICAMLISSFFWIPAYVEGKYTLRDIVTGKDIVNRLVPFLQFVYAPWSYGGTDTLSKEFGIPQWIAVALSIFFLFRMKDTHKRIFILGTLCVLLYSGFMMIGLSAPIWTAISLLQKFQFPWRYLSLVVLCTAILGSIVVSLVSDKYKIFLSLGLALVAVITTTYMWQPISYVQYTESFFTGIYNGTTDTGESSPIWSTRFMEHRADAPVEVIDGQASIVLGKRLSTLHEYVIDSAKETRMVENTVYFPGWIVKIDGMNTSIEFQDQKYRGLITFYVPKGRHEVQVVFTDTKIRKYSKILSLVGLVLTGLIFYSSVWIKRK